ncbi:hypothetical protein COEREDRAFT_90022 [Coemansia reversa NRRL 1564]|uniref:Uncharacterized protein n=1 Tax=Coemansia reversa (strain ATCC 12441 / NRRL 1564) TaxID=763665 RepID=A0A2G5B2A9_COERN|nr:hypothetical protein COEREDRAFT_90022 [Coemansia reversa NRRL 1564]|eukprot:PIA12847.1 hypothetical protein COEREDRAFT_90022 [Coemansia reversa NRRL 1564]
MCRYFNAGDTFPCQTPSCNSYGITGTCGHSVIRYCRYKPKQEWCGYHDPLRWHKRKQEVFPVELPGSKGLLTQSGSAPNNQDLIENLNIELKKQQCQMKEEFNNIKASLSEQCRSLAENGNSFPSQNEDIKTMFEFHQKHLEVQYRFTKTKLNDIRKSSDRVPQLKRSLDRISRFLGLENAPCPKHGSDENFNCVSHNKLFCPSCRTEGESCARCIEDKQSLNDNTLYEDEKTRTSILDLFAKQIEAAIKPIYNVVFLMKNELQKSSTDILAKQEDMMKEQ